MSFISKKFGPNGADPDTHLLRAMVAAYGSEDAYRGTFDEFSISGHVAFERPGLLEALSAAGLDPHLTGRHGFLTPTSVARVRQWLERAEAREIDGVRLERDRIGWYEFIPGERV